MPGPVRAPGAGHGRYGVVREGAVVVEAVGGLADPITRLCVPLTTLTLPWSHSCWPDFFAGLSESTYHFPSAVRLRVRARPTVTGAVS